MKNYFLAITILMGVFSASAQAPQKFNYQAVARHSDGSLIFNQHISVMMMIHQNAENGIVIYSELHHPTTNQYGLFSLPLGGGVVVTGDFTSINWGAGTYFIEVQIDQDGGTNYVPLGAAQLLSVPYALYAETSGNAVSGAGWGLVGNAGINSVTDFIGTTDNTSFHIRVNNQPSAMLDSSSENSFFGYQAGMHNSTAHHNSAIGFHSLLFNETGSYNTALGVNTLYWNATGHDNIAIGPASLYGNVTGHNNIACGSGALESNNDGFNNVAIGPYSIYQNTSGHGNIGIGYSVLQSNTQGNGNMALGDLSLNANIDGNQNSAFGNSALTSNIHGNNNVAIGNFSLSSALNTNNNTALGDSAFYDGIGYTNSTALGFSTQISASNQVRIGNTAVTSIGGQVSWTTVSDARLKQNIHAGTLGLDFILRLKPVTYNYTAEGQQGIWYNGFIAQDVEHAAKEAGATFSGVDVPKNENDYYGLRYGDFSVPLVQAVQEQQKMIEELRTENTKLKFYNEQMEERIKHVEQVMQLQVK